MNTELLLSLALLLVIAKVLGYIFERLRLSSLLGEISAGILLGPALQLVRPEATLAEIAELGILFFLFLIGLSTKFDEFKESIYKSSFVAAGGSLLSFAFGFVLGWLAFGSFQIAAFFGIALMSTSTAISIRSVIDAGKFHTDAGRMIVTVNVADEVITILALSLLGTYSVSGGFQLWEVFSLFLLIIGFFLFILTFGATMIGRLLHFSHRLKDEQILLSMALGAVFIVAFISEHVGVAAVTGAFLAGMAISKSPYTESVIIPKAKAVGYGLFIPLFFAYSAIIWDISAFLANLWLVVALVAVGVLGKVLGCGFFGRFAKLSRRERWALGVAMVPRGEYTIITAQIVLTAGIITGQIYTVILSFVILSILATPILMGLVGKR